SKLGVANRIRIRRRTFSSLVFSPLPDPQSQETTQRGKGKEEPMNPLIQLKTTTRLVIPLVLVCFALLPSTQAAELPAALPAPTPDGAYKGFNTAEGLNSLLSLSTGTFNTALGFAALRSDSTGSFNTAVGGQALKSNTGSGNTAVGVNALVNNTSADENTAVG